MGFNSFQYLCFLPIVIWIYFLIPHRFRWLFLLAASYYFYACWKIEYTALIIISTLVTYGTGIAMDGTRLLFHRKLLLILSLVTNLGILVSFKYLNFITASLNNLFNHFNVINNLPTLKILLPIGISFYIFQALSYTIDVYQGKRRSEKHFGILALYVSFFPQLVAGPIERSTRLLPQFHVKQKINYQNLSDGLKTITWGFFQKIVIADQLAIYVNEVYNNIDNYQGLSIVLATYFFAFQIYCDFSGYSNIAIGSAQMMGFRLMQNFNKPYFSLSVRDFWTRWHISLSTWFRDYLYIPLGGNRKGKYRRYINLIIVFLLSGLWHGASWTFFIWGALHGLYVILHVMTRSLRLKLKHVFDILNLMDIHRLIGILLTFHLVLFAWIFFRANTISDAFEVITRIWMGLSPVHGDWFIRGIGMNDLIMSIILIMLIISIEISQIKFNLIKIISNTPGWFRWPIYYATVMSILLFGNLSSQNQFIYFQF